MLIWSHRWDFIAKVLAISVLIAVAVTTGIIDKAQHLGAAALGDAIGVAVCIVLAGLGYVALWRPLLGPLSTWLYVYDTYDVQPTWAQARALSTLFAPSLTDRGRWYSCTDVASLPAVLRIPTLEHRLAAVTAQRADKLAAPRRG